MRKKSDKERVYTILADLVELFPVLSNCYLNTNRELSTMARHKHANDVASKLATELGGFFEAKVVEVDDADGGV